MEELPRVPVPEECEVDVSLLACFMSARGAMVEDLPEIAEMDFNPIKVLSPGRGCVVVDTRILLPRI
jgi:hypothetical protein